MVYSNVELKHRLFVRTDERGKHLPNTDVIQEHFLTYGALLDVHRPPNSPDICYVTFADESGIQAALREPSTFVGGSSVTLQLAQPRMNSTAQPLNAVSSNATAKGPAFEAVSQRQTPQAAAAFAESSRVYVTGIPNEVTEEHLASYFAQYGAVKDVYIPYDKASGMRRLFAFITMLSCRDAENVASMGQHQVLDGIWVQATLAEPRNHSDSGKGGPHGPSEHGARSFNTMSTLGGLLSSGFGALNSGLSQGLGSAQGQSSWSSTPAGTGMSKRKAMHGAGTTRLFVFGMPEGLNADMLRGHFARHGELKDVYIPQSKSDIGFVTFHTEAELQDALMHSGLRIAGYLVKGLKPAENKPGQMQTSSGFGRARLE